MTDQQLPSASLSSFEKLKLRNEHGAEYWSARDLQPLLGYSQWRRFEDAITRAVTSCEQSGNEPGNHFAGAGKMVELGSGSVREVEEYHLSRFACYLIAQNGDPRKPAIAQAQRYFAVQTRRQELSDEFAADLERLEMRKQTAEEFKALSSAARQAGVESRVFGVFHDAGYKGLYGGLGNEAIKVRKRIAPKEQLMDRMNATELAANQFRMTQARDKLARERIRTQRGAIDAHATCRARGPRGDPSDRRHPARGHPAGRAHQDGGEARQSRQAQARAGRAGRVGLARRARRGSMIAANKPITIVCGTCGSRDVSRDAWADWDDTGQRWVLRTMFDYAHCHACDEETRLDEVPLARPPELRGRRQPTSPATMRARR